MKKYLSITSLLVLFSFVFLGFKASAQSTSCFSNQIYYLQYGSRDSSTKGEVTKLQNFLIQKGFLGANPSGYFGPTTKQAVIAYQKSKGLTAQGFVGNMTRKVMNSDGCDSGVNSTSNTNNNSSSAIWSSLILPVGSTFINFKYPSINGIDLKPTISVIDKSRLSPDGCLHEYTSNTNCSKYTFNGITFYQSFTSDVAAGTAFTSYSNIFLLDGKYYNLYFQMGKSNICNSMNDQNACHYQNNTIDALLKLVNQSLSTAYIKG